MSDLIICKKCKNRCHVEWVGGSGYKGGHEEDEPVSDCCGADIEVEQDFDYPDEVYYE